MQAIRALVLVKMEHNFRIGVGSKVVAFAFQFPAQFGEVINLPVVGNPNSAILIAHRHVTAGRKIEDGKAAAPETDVRTVRESALPQAGIVRTTVRLHVRHPSQYFPASTVGQSGDATHTRARNAFLLPIPFSSFPYFCSFGL